MTREKYNLCSYLNTISLFSWNKTIPHLAASGFGGIAIEFPHFAENVDDAVNSLHSEISKVAFMPPIMIAHSLSSFVAQKYLESYALAGLIMVNPIPPDPAKSSTLLLERWSSLRGYKPVKLSHSDLDDVVLDYYRADIQEPQQFYQKLGLDPSQQQFIGSKDLHDFLESSAHSKDKDAPCLGTTMLMHSLVEDPSVCLNLEPGSVPMFLIYTEDDQHLLNQSDMLNLMDYHDIPEDYEASLEKENSRLPMLFSSSSFNGIISSWCEMLA